MAQLAVWQALAVEEWDAAAAAALTAALQAAGKDAANAVYNPEGESLPLLQHAVHMGSLDKVKLLLEAGASVGVKGGYALCLAARKGHAACERMLKIAQQKFAAEKDAADAAAHHEIVRFVKRGVVWVRDLTTHEVWQECVL